jgi:hypothetical protein
MVKMGTYRRVVGLHFCHNQTGHAAGPTKGGSMLKWLVSVTAVVFILASALAQAPPDCTTQPCVYVSIVQVPVLPTPTATLVPQTGVQVQANHSAYVGAFGFFYVVGEVKNTTAQSVTFVSVPIEMLNAQGQVIGDGAGHMYLYTLLPGETTCFRALLIDSSARVSYRFLPVDYNVTNMVVPDLRISDDSGVLDPPDDYRVLGQLRNASDAAVQSIIMSSTLYDAVGTVVDCNWGGPENDTLGANKTVPFDVLFSGRSTYADVTRYQIQPDAEFFTN